MDKRDARKFSESRKEEKRGSCGLCAVTVRYCQYTIITYKLVVVDDTTILPGPFRTFSNRPHPKIENCVGLTWKYLFFEYDILVYLFLMPFWRATGIIIGEMDLLRIGDT